MRKLFAWEIQTIINYKLTCKSFWAFASWEYLEKFGLLSNTQFGFRNKVSTIDALVYCTETIRYHINNKNFITAALLDLSKAFDSINHNILLHNLHELGFSKKCLKPNRKLSITQATRNHSESCGIRLDWVISRCPTGNSLRSPSF